MMRGQAPQIFFLEPPLLIGAASTAHCSAIVLYLHALYHRRRLLEMTVWAIPLPFPSPPLPALPPPPCSPVPLPSIPFFPFPPPSPVPVPSYLFPFAFPSPYPYPLNPARGSGERCKLPHWVRAEPGRQTLLVHFQAEISAPFVTCIMTHS